MLETAAYAAPMIKARNEKMIILGPITVANGGTEIGCAVEFMFEVDQEEKKNTVCQQINWQCSTENSKCNYPIALLKGDVY